MSIKIKVGYIGSDIVSLCTDAEADYAFHATKQRDGSYKVRTSSSHGLITSGTFKPGVGTREMIYYSLAKHLEEVDRQQNSEDHEKDRSLN